MWATSPGQSRWWEGVRRSESRTTASASRANRNRPGRRQGAGAIRATRPLPIQPPSSSQRTDRGARSEEHTSELQSRGHLVCRLLLEKKKTKDYISNKQYVCIDDEC